MAHAGRGEKAPRVSPMPLSEDKATWSSRASSSAVESRGSSNRLATGGSYSSAGISWKARPHGIRTLRSTVLMEACATAVLGQSPSGTAGVLALGTAPSACLCEQSSSTVPWPSRPFPLYSSALQGGTKHQEGAGQVHT